MKTKKGTRKPDLEKVVFSLEAENASEVYLLGNFNEWDPQRTPMKRKGNKKWTASLSLPAGEYEYKFMVDGQWVEDPMNERVRPNDFGTHNNIFNVSPKSA